MYSRFRNSELFSSGTNSSFVFENVATENDGAFLDILTCFYLQYAHSNTQYFYLCICGHISVNDAGTRHCRKFIGMRILNQFCKSVYYG